MTENAADRLVAAPPDQLGHQLRDEGLTRATDATDAEHRQRRLATVTEADR
jgi:hypothetical protein